MAVKTAGRAVAAAVGTALLALSAAACSPGDLFTTSDSNASASASASASAAEKPDAAVLAKLPAELAEDGTTIVVGDTTAKTTVHLYEDPRCPACKAFEDENAATMAELAKDGKIKIQYTIASFLDENLGGTGSVKGANALRAALDAGKFPEFHAAIYENQPKESVDGFTVDYLLELADDIDGLRSTTFDTAVKKQKYSVWVALSEQAFLSSGSNSTPTIMIDGKQVDQPAAVEKLNALAGGS